MIHALQLPFHFDPRALRSDLEKVLSLPWSAHYNTGGYKGSWEIISLLAPGGKSEQIFAMHGDTKLEETPILKECSSFQDVLARFQCPIESARLMKLKVGAHILPHKDYALGYEDGTFRIHVPIVTNPQIEFIVDDQRVVMQEGECWYTNVNLTHSVANRGTEDRVHLVMDFTRNDWSDELFFSLAPADELLAQATQAINDEMKFQMLRSLQEQDSPASRQLVEELKRDLGLQ